MILLFIYWIATTIYGSYWLVINDDPEERSYLDYYSLLEILAKIFPAALVAWLAIPLYLLHQVKFKRKK